MDEFSRTHVPPFGSWDCNGDLPFTQCFESATTQAGLLRYTYSRDRDLYVAGDLYDNNVVTPAMIVVPRRRRGKAGGGYNNKHGKREKKEAWVVCDYDYNYGYGYDCDVKAPPCPVTVAVSSPRKPRTQPKPPKAVDEDLYKISPELLRAKPKRKRVWGLISCCFVPSCV